MPHTRGALACQAIVLAGGDDKHLHPLTGAGNVKALLPVANRALLSYPLRTLSDAGFKHAFVVAAGDRAAASISSWLEKDHGASAGLHCEVITVPEECGTADALRLIAARVSAPTLAVLSGDLLTDVSLAGLIASHQLGNALATVLLHKRRVSPASETKPGKPPKNVDFIGLNPTREHLLFYASSPETLRDIKVPLSVVKKFGVMTIHSDLCDAHLYIFNRSVLGMLTNKASLASVRQDFLPWLTQQQLKLKPTRGAGLAGQVEGDKDVAPSGDEAGSDGLLEGPLPGAHYMAMAHGGAADAPAAEQESTLRVHLVPPSSYCARVADLATFTEVNREVADSSTALHLSGLRPSKYDNIVPPSTTVGNKATIATGCVLGENCSVGDKTSIKRSVLGNAVKLGAMVKVINSVILDGVVLGDHCHVQNCILCPGASVLERATLKDCQVGPGFTVASGSDYSGEVLAKPRMAA